MTCTYQSSAIFVRDIAASRRFYEGLLGQEVEMDHGTSLTFKGGFALWQVDHAFQTIYERSPEPDRAGSTGQHNYELHFETADAAEASVRLSEAGVEFVHPLREMPWGKRIFRVRDPDRHVVAIGEPMHAVIARLLGQGMSARAVAERTGMPLEIVEQTAEGDA
jgi:catechol 2,3-dioxygenase-like lactoylglutathione lyase family enzyme